MCRALLTAEDLLDVFDVTVFSDEQGTYKPDVRIFEHTLSTLGVDPDAALHVGDRRRTDVAGALDAGMGAVRYRRRLRRPRRRVSRTRLFVIEHHDELAALCAIP